MWEVNLVKKSILLLLVLLLLAVPCVAMADSTPVRDLAVVTPADDDTAAEEDKTADNADLVKPVDDDASRDSENTNNADSSDKSDNNNSDIPDNANDTLQTAPILPDTLTVQFQDIATSNSAEQIVIPVSLSVRGSYLDSDVPAMAISGRTLVPVRVISENLSATVDWKKEDNTVTIKLSDKTVILTIGKNTAEINGETVAVPDNVSVSTVNYEGISRTMVPVRFVSEALTATVNYDGVNRNVDIIPPNTDNFTDSEEEEPKRLPGVDENGNLYRRVVIDAGHGGNDPGTNGGGWEEKVITLSVAQKVQALLEAADFEVFMSREDDTFIPLTDRAALTEVYDAPIFVSIHCNAAENIPTANGIETYAAPNDDGDSELAGYLQKQLIAATAAKDRGVKTSRLVVLTHNLAPACLVEIGFMTNTDECAKITDDTYQDTLAEAICAGINDYFAAK